MSIYGLNTDIKSTIKIKEDNSIVPLYDSDRTNKELLTILPGIKWKVTYFHRQVDANTLITQYDPNLDLSIQNFIRVNDFIIHVDSALPNGIPDNLVGSGIIDIDFVPNPNDVFLMKLPDGRIGMFTITSISRINYNEETLYKIEYILYTGFNDLEDPIYKVLLNSVGEEFYYNEKFRLSDVYPLYTKDEFINRKLYLEYIDDLLKNWNISFITKDTNFYMGYILDTDKVYDPYIERFITSVIGVTNLDNTVELLELENNDLTVLDYTLETANIKSNIIKYKDIVSSSILGGNPYLTGIIFSGSFSKVVSVTSIDDSTILIDDSILNIHFPKVNSKNYIFRDYVYRVINGENINNVTDNLTTFERVYLYMVTNNTVSKEDIRLVYENIYDLPDEEKFYFIPIFIYILKYYLITFTVKFV